MFIIGLTTGMQITGLSDNWMAVTARGSDKFCFLYKVIIFQKTQLIDLTLLVLLHGE